MFAKLVILTNERMWFEIFLKCENLVNLVITEIQIYYIGSSSYTRDSIISKNNLHEKGPAMNIHPGLDFSAGRTSARKQTLRNAADQLGD